MTQGKITAMMTVHRLSAGDGYAYYIRETVSADQAREEGQELGDYYTATGNPPGVWMGSGIELLGVSGTVSEEQMRALFGEGLHPDADRIIAERIAAGATAKQSVKAARLGRAYMQFNDAETVFGKRFKEELERHARTENRAATAAERAAMRGKVGAVLFREEYGRSPESKEELGKFVKQQEGSKPRNAVAGFDLVFSAPKSVSVLWALGDEQLRQTIEQAHLQAISDTVQWLEQNATMTRTGVNGVAQEDVHRGLIATRFRHFDNRHSEPMLHDHVVVSNKVMGLDGKWRALDSALLYSQNVPASELYNQRVVEEVCARLDLRAEPREVTPGKRPVMEIAGVGYDLIEAHSGRSMSIKERTAELVEQYRQKHGYEPSQKALIALTQQATLDTRPEKKAARPLADMRVDWRRSAVEKFGVQRVDGLLEDARAAAATNRPHPAALARIDIEKAAREVLTTVDDYRSVWGRRQVLAEARRWVMTATKGTVMGGDLADRITERVLNVEAINITPADLNPRFEPLTRADGSSIYRRRETELFTSTAVLAAEDRIVAAARTSVIPAVSVPTYKRVEEAYQQANPTRQLDAGQRALAQAFATGEKLVIAGIGPAGAGKTTAMKVAADAVRAAGGRVIGLGPSARAASELSSGIEAPAYVLHEWLGARERHRQGQRLRPEFELGPGDLIIIDEAGMAGSKRIAGVVAEAQEAGAVVRLIGDPAQLASVESGGALRLLANTVPVVELETVHRFRAAGEAAASLMLRNGEPEKAWAWYIDNGRIVAGTREQMQAQIFADWQRDSDAGKSAMMMADDRVTVSELNALAQAYRMGAGQLDRSQTADLHDGLQAHRGDLVVTRDNDRRNVVRGGKDFVKNGDQWVVERITDEGDLVVRHADHGGRTLLAADYVERFVELGYASTGHRGQGATVATGSGLVTRRTTREGAYVQLTRGREENRLYVIVEEGQTMHDVLDSIARNIQASLSATESIQAEQERAWGIPQLSAEYTDVHDRALSLRYQSMARNVLHYDAEALIASEGWRRSVEGALRRAEAAGFTPERILKSAFFERDFHDAEDRADVLGWRIDRQVAEARHKMAELSASASSRPLADLTDTQLDRLAERAGERRRQALDSLRQADARVASQPRTLVVDGLPVPAWPGRAYGDLTTSELSQSIAEARRDGRTAAAQIAHAQQEQRELKAEVLRATVRAREGDPGAVEWLRTAGHEHRLTVELGTVAEQARIDERAAVERLMALRREQRLRADMPWVDRAREEWQREPGPAAAHTAGMDGASVATEMRANLLELEEAKQRLQRAEVVDQRVKAEQRLRVMLPDASVPVPDFTAAVPEWLAARAAERDQHTPAAWIEHLRARREVIEQRLIMTGQILADEPPRWAQALGPVPEGGSELRAEWERAAALADAWREQRRVPDTQPGIGPRPARDEDAAAWEALRGQVAEVGRRSRATQAAARRGEELAAAGAFQQAPTRRDETEPLALAVDQRAESTQAREEVEVEQDVAAEENVMTTLTAEQDVEVFVETPSITEEVAREIESPEPEPERVVDLDRGRDAESVEPAAQREERGEDVDRVLPGSRDIVDEQDRTETAAVEEPAVRVEEPETRNAGKQAGEVEPASETRPYADLPDADLSETLAYYVEAAASAQEHAAAQQAKAAELVAALEPGGAVERNVDERAARVQAIQDLRAAATRVSELDTRQDRQQRAAAAVEQQLAETGRFGRPAVRGDDRTQLEERLLNLRAEAETTREQLVAARQQQEANAQKAGNPAEHDEVLASWQRSGGSREEVLERTRAVRQRRADAAVAQASAARGEVTQLDKAAAAVRKELNHRDGQPYEQRVADEARRIQAQQAAALQQQAQQSAQQPGPEDQQNRSGPKR
ncbi:MobF family relaxase [Streptomyces sp. NBC_00239]|uniref:MobF family relaxase n=1 Tax=Streptomyces sp. NBC_00239 TaxID=2903640 RepID=UPI002E2D2CB3|nr:MobF family relaxase [Streptomyces sp. NBC_00239]